MDSATTQSQDERRVKPIPQSSIHRICSGQVILDLATGVKELIENALDAGAKNIQIRLKEYGADLIEVADDGSGINPCDYETVALKHYTSKISDFDDLKSLSTFGFRGEALSSLCAISKMSILTRTQTQPMGSRLLYDDHGRLAEQSRAARERGTTIVVKDIFSTLPVRLKEFKKNIRKEFARLLFVLQSYVIISTDVKFHCSNQIGTGNRTTIISSDRNSNVRANFTNIFGPKQADMMVDYDFHDDQVRMCGIISRKTTNCGRSANDRQFYFINGRPVDIPKFSKLINEIYRSFNPSQYPMVVWNLTLEKDAFDVNVTPDKRKTFVHDEAKLLDFLKDNLLRFFDHTNASIPVNMPLGFTQTTSRNDEDDFQPTDTCCILESSQPTSTECDANEQEPMKDSNKRALSQSLVPHLSSSVYSPHKLGRFLSGVTSSQSHQTISTTPTHVSKNVTLQIGETRQNSVHASIHPDKEVSTDDFTLVQSVDLAVSKHDCIVENEVSDSEPHLLDQAATSNIPCNLDSQVESDSNSELSKPVLQQKSEMETVQVNHIDSDQNDIYKHVRIFTDVSLNIEELKSRFLTRTQNVDWEYQCLSRMSSQGTTGFSVDMESSQAEDELVRIFKKDHFRDMIVLGQFNLGFIIARRGGDIFIIDQHASDEKFNFETLQKSTEIHTQKLISPIEMELTVSEEIIVRDHLHIFKQNGFDFEFDDQVWIPIALI
eukprot:TRINITY_DN1329_c0_g1_i15.p1 TRINITY_DN1329_c0_g1~~TRINITY_DN1329_c0_g1_i15.p1  ORF type:complete len:719 (-),score=147.45 TRINITY_DN1329_c0_g1_i15:876-3032(-)